MLARFGKVDGVQIVVGLAHDAEFRNAHVRRARPVNLQRRLGILFHGERECKILISELLVEFRHAHVAPPQLFSLFVEHAQHARHVFYGIFFGAQIVYEHARRRRVSGFAQHFGFRRAQHARFIRLRNRAPARVHRQVAHFVQHVGFRHAPNLRVSGKIDFLLHRFFHFDFFFHFHDVRTTRNGAERKSHAQNC